MNKYGSKLSLRMNFMKDSLMTSQETSAYNVCFFLISKERAKLDCINHFS